MQPVSYYNFSILAPMYLTLSGVYMNHSVQLTWTDHDPVLADYYTIEKSDLNNEFRPIGAVKVNGNRIGFSAPNVFSFMDAGAPYGDNLYRIKATAKSGATIYSNSFKVVVVNSGERKFFVAVNPGGTSASLITSSKEDCNATVVIYNITGAVLQTKSVQLTKGINTVNMPLNRNFKYSVLVVSLYINRQFSGSEKIVF